MLVNKEQNLSEIQSEVFDLMVGYKEKEQLNQKKRAIRRSLETRRAIEQHYEEKQLHDNIDEPWFNE